jgi:dihydroflavonol-4-reductase
VITVTGATGHIGNVLVKELLRRGQKVRALILPGEDLSPLDDTGAETVYGDVRDLRSLCQAFRSSGTVYHLAGVISIVPGKRKVLEQVNVGGTRNVVEACLRERVGRLVYVSSIHAIKETPRGTAVTESQPFDPACVLGEYARSKAQASLEVLKGVKRGLDAVLVCPTGVIGPNDYYGSEMGQLIQRFLSRKLPAYVDGAYDFVDVRDVANGIILAGEKGTRGETYILSGEQVTVRGLLSTLERVSGVKAPSFKAPGWLAKLAGMLASPFYARSRRKPLFTAYSIDVLHSNSLVHCDKARRALGYTSRPVTESVADAVTWFRARRARPTGEAT